MLKRPYVRAIVCCLLIPVVVIAGARLAHLIDPQWALGHGNYERDFKLLELVRTGVLMAVGGLAAILWGAVCWLVLASRQRSLGWLLLAGAGPFGFIAIAMLGDRSPAPDDLYQQVLAKLKLYWRVPLEIAVFVSAWVLAFLAVAIKGDLMIRYESYSTGTPVETIVERQNASSGMYAFGEGLEAMFLVVLFYLLWPVAFNLVGRLFRTGPAAQGT